MNHTALAMLSGCLLLAASATSQTKSAAWTTPSTEDVNAVYPEVESLYFDFHRTPELAMHEQQTAAKLVDRVKAMGYEVTTGGCLSLLCCVTSAATITCAFPSTAICAL